MYAEYKYNSGHTAATILSDIVALMTGTIDKNTLSSSCNKTTTTITADYDPAGWAVWDNAAGTNKVVLRAPCEGDVNQYKYLLLDTDTYPDYLVINAHSDWDADTHVGVNPVTGEGLTPMGFSYSTTLQGEVKLSCTNRRAIFNAAVNGSFGNPSILLEYDRYLTSAYVGSGHVPMVQHWYPAEYGNTGFGWSQIRLNSGTSYNSFVHAPTVLNVVGGAYPGTSQPFLSDASRPIVLSDFYISTNQHIYLPSFKVSGLKSLVMVPSYALYDEFTYDSKTHVIMHIMSVHGAVPKG